MIDYFSRLLPASRAFEQASFLSQISDCLRRSDDRKGDLSRFIEEAVRAYLFERAVDQAKSATAGMSERDKDRFRKVLSEF